MSLSEAIQGFRQGNLRPAATVVTHQNGDRYLESEGTVEKIVTLPEDPSKVLGVFYVIDTKPDERLYTIIPRVYIGSQDAAGNLEGLKTAKVTHILNVAVAIEDQFPQDFIYLDKPVYDIPEFDIRTCFEECCRFIHDAIKNGAVLIHCNAGVSRSSTIAIAYLIKHHQMSYANAYNHVKSARSAIKPNDGFIRQLKDFEMELKQKPVN